MNRRPDKYSSTYISGSSEHYLKLAVFCLKHRKNTGRSFDPEYLNMSEVRACAPQKKAVDSFKMDNVLAPVFTNKMLEKEPDRVWELLDEYLCAVRDGSGIPLAAWTRATKNLFPKDADTDDPSDYDTMDHELIERAPIILEE